jgi:ribonucleotide monophosphatase NagD (HAD superfamily)
MTGLELPFTQFGKPHKTTYDFAETMLRRHLKQMGGDAESELDV